MSRSHRHLAASLVVAIAFSPVAPLPVMAEAPGECTPGTPGCPIKIPPKPSQQQNNNRGGGNNGVQGQQRNGVAPVSPGQGSRDNNGSNNGGQQGNGFVPFKPQTNNNNNGNTNRGGGFNGGQGQQGNGFVPLKPQTNGGNGGNNQGQQGNGFVPLKPQTNNTNRGGNNGGQGNGFAPIKPDQGSRDSNGSNNGGQGQQGNGFVPFKPQTNNNNNNNNRGGFNGQQGNGFVPIKPDQGSRDSNGSNNGGQGQQGNGFLPFKPQTNNNNRGGYNGRPGDGFLPGQPFQNGRPPLAAGHGANDFRPGDRTHEYHLGAGDVRTSRNNDWNRRYDRNSGMSDFEKFGLIALGAVVIGSLLSNGDTVVSNSGDRIVYRDSYGRYGVYHDDDVLIRRPGDTITTQSYDDGSVATRIVQPDGSIILTVRDAYGRVVRRTVTYPNGREVLLFDDTVVLPPPVVAQLPPQSPVDVLYTMQTGPDLLRAAFLTKPFQPAGRFFNLSQIRDIPQVRYLSPEVEITTLAFPSGSSAIGPDQAQSLAVLGHVMADMIAQNPAEVFLIEGHSDAVGDPGMNLALSDARAQATALALTEYYGVPPQNLITQGYGESDMKNQTQYSDEANRRIVVRRITELLPQTGQ